MSPERWCWVTSSLLLLTLSYSSLVLVTTYLPLLIPYPIHTIQSAVIVSTLLPTPMVTDDLTILSYTITHGVSM